MGRSGAVWRDAAAGGVWWLTLVGAVTTGTAASARAQGADPRPPARAEAPRISMALLDVPLAEALERLASMGAINLVWQAETLGDRARVRVSCRVDEDTAEAMLRCLTRRVGLDYVRLSTGTYVVIAAAALPPTLATLAGSITDAASGAPVPAARVQLAAADTRVTLAADDGGFRLAQLPPGRYDVTVRALGFRPYRRTMQLEGGGAALRVALERSEVVTTPIIVQGLRPGELSARLGTSTLTAPQAVTVLGPSLFLPGAVAPLGASRRDGIGDLHLQGGDVGEHPWRLDGVPLYDAANLSGLLGIVSPTVIDQVRVQRSGYGADVGSFATGVLDLTHAMGADSARPTIGAAIDPLAASARATTPLRVGSARGTAMVAMRRGLWAWTAPPALTRALQHWSLPDPVLLDRVSGFGAVPAMADLDARTFRTDVGTDAVTQQDLHVASRLRAGVAHEVTASAFQLANGLRHDAAAVDSSGQTLTTMDDFVWRTTGGQITHRWLLGTRVRQQLQLRASRHVLTHDATMAMRGPSSALLPLGIAGREHNAISEATMAPEWRVAITDRVTGHAGFDVTRTSARLDLENRVLQPLRARSAPWRGSAFVQAALPLTRTTQLDAGVRVTSLRGGATYAEPRLAVRGESPAPGAPWSWRVAGGGYHQFVSQFDVASTMPVALVPSLRFWLPADARTPVAQAWHLASEGVWRPARGWEVRGEAYARWHPVLPMLDYGVMYPTPGSAMDTTRPFIAASTGWARGAGARVVRDARVAVGTWRTELGLDAAWAARRFPSRFGGQRQAPPWLEPLRASLASELATRGGLRLSVRARSIAQRPWALRQSYYDLFGAAPDAAGLPLAMPGTMRRPTLLDVDAGASWAIRLNGTTVELAASVLNAIDRANVLDYSLRRRAGGDGYVMVPRFLMARQTAVTVRLY